jgi:primosomal protein N''
MYTRFWEDSWLGDAPLFRQYASLHNTVQQKQVSVADTMAHMHLNITLRRTLSSNKWEKWIELVERLMHVQLSNKKDMFV